MDLKENFNSLVPRLFWARPKFEFGEHVATQASNNVWEKYCCVGDFRQRVAVFVL